MLFIIAIIAILIEAYLRREAIRGHHRLIRGSSEAQQRLISANHPKWWRT